MMKQAIANILKRLAVSNIHLYDFVRTRIARLPMFLPHDPDFYGLAEFGDGDRLFLDIGANDGISARSYRKLIQNRPILSIDANDKHRPALGALKSQIANFDFEIIGFSDRQSSLTLNTPIYKGVAMTNYASTDRDVAKANLSRHMRIRNIAETVSFHESIVDVVTVDSMNLDPALVKIDVEGHEASVIRGMLKTIERSRPPIMIEYNPASFEELTELLQQQGYEPFTYSQDQNKFLPFGGDTALNLFFLPPPQSS